MLLVEGDVGLDQEQIPLDATENYAHPLIAIGNFVFPSMTLVYYCHPLVAIAAAGVCYFE